MRSYLPVLCSASIGAAAAFVAQRPTVPSSSPPFVVGTTSLPSAATASATETDADPLGLTPELRKITDAFSSIPDEKMRYKQLLFMAGQLQPVDDSVRIPENKVPGCLSTVHVDCTAEMDDERGEKVVTFVGDSDGLLTKGLVALLIRGLSGCTPEEISRVDPEFIHAAKISQSLTPGRNNGFLNMIAMMKRKAQEVAGDGDADDTGTAATTTTATDEKAKEEDAAGEGGEIITTFEERDGKPMYNAILSTLIPVLKPTSITLVDNSDQHAGHAGSKGWEESGESHFALEIVSEAFGGLASVKRHQLIYMLLGDTMQKIHALQISAKTPDEV